MFAYPSSIDYVKHGPVYASCFPLVTIFSAYWSSEQSIICPLRYFPWNPIERIKMVSVTNKGKSPLQAGRIFRLFVLKAYSLCQEFFFLQVFSIYMYKYDIAMGAILYEVISEGYARLISRRTQTGIRTNDLKNKFRAPANPGKRTNNGQSDP